MVNVLPDIEEYTFVGLSKGKCDCTPTCNIGNINFKGREYRYPTIGYLDNNEVQQLLGTGSVKALLAWYAVNHRMVSGNDFLPITMSHSIYDWLKESGGFDTFKKLFTTAVQTVKPGVSDFNTALAETVKALLSSRLATSKFFKDVRYKHLTEKIIMPLQGGTITEVPANQMGLFKLDVDKLDVQYIGKPQFPTQQDLDQLRNSQPGAEKKWIYVLGPSNIPLYIQISLQNCKARRNGEPMESVLANPHCVKLMIRMHALYVLVLKKEMSGNVITRCTSSHILVTNATVASLFGHGRRRYYGGGGGGGGGGGTPITIKPPSGLSAVPAQQETSVAPPPPPAPAPKEEEGETTIESLF